MISASDTNIFVALWDRDHALNYAAQAALENAAKRGRLIVAAPVFAELLACPGRDQDVLRTFFSGRCESPSTGTSVKTFGWQQAAPSRRTTLDGGPVMPVLAGS
jgi:hypothetical protein